MKRNSNDKWLGGVIGGFSEWIGVNSNFLRVIFIVLFLGIGGLSFGIGWGAVVVIYLLLWLIVEEK
ncbi:MAG: PspC domain [Bacteroidota bacterium]|jgi:phage shock protein PspC (stress-responsive transcriptional regulator)